MKNNLKYSMEAKKILSLLVVSIFLLSFISGAITVNLVNPASDGRVSGTTQATNVTFTDQGLVNVTSCTIYASSSSTANSTATNISIVTNTTTNTTTSLNATVWNTFNIEDATDYSVYASCTNITGTYFNSTTNTGIEVNNSIPSAPTSLAPASATTDTDGDVTFSATVTGANTTECFLFFVGGVSFGASSRTMTHTANSCSLTINDIPSLTYEYIIEVNDGTERINSSNTRVIINSDTSGPSYLFNNQKAFQKAQENNSNEIGLLQKFFNWLKNLFN